MIVLLRLAQEGDSRIWGIDFISSYGKTKCRCEAAYAVTCACASLVYFHTMGKLIPFVSEAALKDLESAQLLGLKDVSLSGP